jgi:hypothetical protein
LKKQQYLSPLCALALALSLGSCMQLNHIVGTGAQGGSEASKRQWYALWGLVPLGEVDARQLAGGATNYTVHSEHGIVDILLNLLTGWVTINSQTVTVTK